MCDRHVIDDADGTTYVCGDESMVSMVFEVKCEGGNWVAMVLMAGVRCRHHGCGDVSLGGQVWESGLCVTVWAWLKSAGGGMVLDVLWRIRGGVASPGDVLVCVSEWFLGEGGESGEPSRRFG